MPLRRRARASGHNGGLVIGETISHYRVLERLGKGGMGEVYLAEDLRLHRQVALKMLRSETPRDEQGQARLLREARTASVLSHPNIAVIYEIDEADSSAGPIRFIAMEYVPGQTLAELARQDAPDLDRVLEIVLQVAEALSEAHARGIVHRDVKPSNLVLTDSGRVKVLDFGLARQQVLPGESDSTWTRAPGQAASDEGLVGTIAYMSPEQALGQEVDGRADVFSLGVVFYELLAGRSPFLGANAAQTLGAILQQDPFPLVARFQDARLPQLEAMLRRMLAKDPRERYPGMREVCDDIELARRGEAPRHALPAAASAALAVLSFANITSSSEDDWLGTGIAETVTTDLKNLEGLTVVSRARIHETLRRLGAEAGAADEALAVQAGRELHTRWVLSGGFQRSGDTVRVTARLTEVATGTIVRTVKIDGRLSEIFDLQDRLVRELSAGLRLTLAPPGGRSADETHLIEAYEAFSKGVLNLRVDSYESLDRAVLQFEHAVRLDPLYARAHLELGAAYFSKADYLAIPELHERALASLRKALELHPGMVRAWREMGGALVSLGREDEGIEAIRRGLELDPEDAGALAAMGRALFVGCAQFKEAAEYFDKALLHNPEGGWYALQLSHCAALMREFERGEAAARRAAQLQEALLSGQDGIRIVGSYMRLGHLAALQGRYKEAVGHLQRELAFLQSVDHALRSRISIELHMRLGAAYLRLGRADEARVALGVGLASFEQRIRLGADDPFTRYYAACIYALRGERQEALACLAKTVKMRRRFTVARARIEPELESLREEPRFQELLGRE